MKLSVIGCGYLGAVHAASMAKLGHDVIAIDVDARKVEALSSGHAPFFEPGLEELLVEALDSGNLTFSTDVSSAAEAAVHFIAVGTPQVANGDAADLSYVRAAFDALLPYLADDAIVVGKSTVPVGTAAELSSHLNAAAPHAALVWNPEFLREGFAVEDTLRPDRIVYGLPAGSARGRAESVLDEVYREALALGTPKISTDYATAELVKVAANAFLATKISFINAMAEVSDAVGADVTQLADAIGYDARIGRKFLGAGVGFGGGCLPKDIRAFRARAEELGVGDSLEFLREVDAINLRRRSHVVDLAVQQFDGSVAERRITVLGASFKPNSDDVRDSPALDIAVRLHELGAIVTVADPRAVENASQRFPDLNYERDTKAALSGTELVLLLTEWAEYRTLDPMEAAGLVTIRAIVDGRNCLDPTSWEAAGWEYIGLGR